MEKCSARALSERLLHRLAFSVLAEESLSSSVWLKTNVTVLESGSTQNYSTRSN